MNERPIIEVDATFLPFEDGGRRVMPDLKAGRYMPHLVVQPPDVREAVVEGGISVEDYLGVTFVAGPTLVVAGEPGRFAVELMYYSDVNYGPLEAGATFPMREGPKVIGYGTVISRPPAVDRQSQPSRRAT